MAQPLRHTDITSDVGAPESSWADVVRQVLDDVEAGSLEVIADDLTCSVRSDLRRPTAERYAAILPETF